jgi:hypothetical protein
MNNIQPLLDRQAAWQKHRAALSWAEKIRMVEAIQETLRQLKNSNPKKRNPKFDSIKSRNENPGNP